jgi:hypothetical protein
MSTKFFSMCGIALILFPLILALFCMTGCLERSPESVQVPSSSQLYPVSNSSLQMDYDVELRGDLFRVQGSLLLPGNGSLSYLLLNASLRQDGGPQINTKYLLMQIEPNRDYSFEICKNAEIPAGEYDFSLRAEGPQGVLFEGKRRVVREASGQSVGSSGSWTKSEEAAFWLGVAEESSREESPSSQKAVSNEPTRSSSASGDQVDVEFGQSATAKSAALSQESVLVVGSITSKKYHRPDCRYVEKIKPENLIRFESAEGAERQGYLPCKSCNP